jgi:predicted nuclease with TOPRIM domain
MLEFWKKIQKYVIGGGIIIACLLLLYFGLRGPSSLFFQSILDRHIEQYRIEYQAKMDAKEAENKELLKKTAELQGQLKVVQANYLKTKQELNTLKKEVVNINEPKTIKEAKDRLNAMGYTVNK